MKILLIKMSSLGDAICTLPALTDLKSHVPDAKVDWILEENFQAVGTWHTVIERVIPIALRRWRHQAWRSRYEAMAFIKALRCERYDCIIDPQGLIKSALVGCLAKGPVSGYTFQSIREPIASIAYRHRILIPWKSHAVDRIRALFAKVLGYSIDLGQEPCFDLKLDASIHARSCLQEPSVLFLPNTSRVMKCWPVASWRALTAILVEQGLEVLLPWVSQDERQRCDQIKQDFPKAQVLPRLSLDEMAALIGRVQGVVTLDTGLGFLAAGMNVPTVALYGPTDPDLVGVRGSHRMYHGFSDEPHVVADSLFKLMEGKR